MHYILRVYCLRSKNRQIESVSVFCVINLRLSENKQNIGSLHWILTWSLVLNTCFSVLCAAADTVCGFYVHPSYTAHIYTSGQWDRKPQGASHVSGRSSPAVVQWLQSDCVSSFKQTLMLFEVILTVRVQTHQTGLDGFVFSSSTDVTLHISSSSVTVSR